MSFSIFVFSVFLVFLSCLYFGFVFIDVFSTLCLVMSWRLSHCLLWLHAWSQSVNPCAHWLRSDWSVHGGVGQAMCFML